MRHHFDRLLKQARTPKRFARHYFPFWSSNVISLRGYQCRALSAMSTTIDTSYTPRDCWCCYHRQGSSRTCCPYVQNSAPLACRHTVPYPNQLLILTTIERMLIRMHRCQTSCCNASTQSEKLVFILTCYAGLKSSPRSGVFPDNPRQGLRRVWTVPHCVSVTVSGVFVIASGQSLASKPTRDCCRHFWQIGMQANGFTLPNSLTPLSGQNIASVTYKQLFEACKR